jgi:hypothetical protein
MITIGNTTTMKAEKVGKIRICVIQCNGRKFQITIENVKFMPDLWVNLFSINKVLMNGFMIGNEGVLIKLTKGETMLVFNQSLNNKGGFLSVIKMVLVLNQVADTAAETKKMNKTISVEII